MLTYKVYFRIALFPEGVRGMHIEEEEGDDGVIYGELVEDDEVFEQYLCNGHQAPFILNELNSIYSSITGDTVTKLHYDNNGKFNCKVTLQNDDWNDDELQQYINELLWPADIHDSAFMFINGKQVNLQIEIDYITDWLDEEDEEGDEEEDEDEIEQKTYNGVYYDDAMEMEAAMKVDAKRRKLIEHLHAKIYPESIQTNNDINQPEK